MVRFINNLDNILAIFNKTRVRLEKYKAKCVDRIAYNNASIKELSSEKDMLQLQYDRAQNALTQIKKILGEKT